MHSVLVAVRVKPWQRSVFCLPDELKKVQAPFELRSIGECSAVTEHSHFSWEPKLNRAQVIEKLTYKRRQSPAAVVRSIVLTPHKYKQKSMHSVFRWRNFVSVKTQHSKSGRSKRNLNSKKYLKAAGGLRRSQSQGLDERINWFIDGLKIDSGQPIADSKTADFVECTSFFFICCNCWSYLIRTITYCNRSRPVHRLSASPLSAVCCRSFNVLKLIM